MLQNTGSKKLRKRGNILDVVTASEIFFTIVIVLFIMFIVLDQFGTNIKLNPSTNITSVTENFDSYKSTFVKAFDYSILFLAIMLPLFSFIAARKIPTDTIYMVIAFFVIGFIFIILMVVSNFYGALMENSDFQNFIAQTTFAPMLLPNLVYYGFIYLFITLTGFFTKKEE